MSEADKIDAARWREFAKNGAADARAEIIRYQDVMRQSPTPTRFFPGDYTSVHVGYDRQAVREVRIRWVDKEGEQPTLLHLIDDAIASNTKETK